jgi:hypothetical protein
MNPREHFKEMRERQRSYFYHLCHVNDTMLVLYTRDLLSGWTHTLNSSERTPNINRFFEDISLGMSLKYEDILYYDLMGHH